MTEPRSERTHDVARALGRRDRNQEKARAAILAAALELFAENGYGPTTVGQIADRADLARRTVFNHFPKKIDMLATWANRRRDRLTRELAEATFRDEPVRRQLHRYAALLTEANEAHPVEARVIVTGWLTEMAAFHDTFPIFDAFRKTAELGQRRRELRPDVSTETIAELLTACYTDTLYRWLQAGGPDGFELGPALRTKLDLVLDGVTADTGPAAP